MQASLHIKIAQNVNSEDILCAGAQMKISINAIAIIWRMEKQI